MRRTGNTRRGLVTHKVVEQDGCGGFSSGADLSEFSPGSSIRPVFVTGRGRRAIRAYRCLEAKAIASRYGQQ